MTALARAGIRQKRLVDCGLRRIRERMLRHGKRWVPSIGRALVHQRGRDPYWTSREDRRQQWLAARKRGRENRAHEDEAVRQKARRLTLPIILEPLSQGTALFEGVRARVGLWWCPDVRPEVSSMLPGTMATQQRVRLADWAHQHFCVKASDAPDLPRESAQTARDRICRRYGTCLCKQPLRKSFVDKWREALGGLLRKTHRSLATVRGPNEAREAFDRGDLLVRTESLENNDDVAWHHVSFASISPFRAVLLEMTPSMLGEPPTGNVYVYLTPTRGSRIAGSADRPWRFVREHVALSCLDLDIRRRVSLFRMEKVMWEFGAACVIHARPILGSQRQFWDGSDEQVPQEDVAPKKGRRESINDKELGENDEGSTTGGEECEDVAPKKGSRASSRPKAGSPAHTIEAKPPQSGAKAGSPAPKVEPKPKATPKAKPQTTFGSMQEWVRPLVPGHPASGTARAPNLSESSLNRVTRSATIVSQWVARYSLTTPMNLKLAKSDRKLKNKTRSVAYHNKCEEHDAFRVTLLWLWRRNAMSSMTPDQLPPLPDHIGKCLLPWKNGELQPCPECSAGTCTFMDRVPDLVMKMVAESGRSAAAARVSSGSAGAAGSQSGPAISDGVLEPAATPSRSGSAVVQDPVGVVVAKSASASSSSAPRPAAMSRPPPVGVCVLCRAPGATWSVGLYVCGPCSREDSAAATKLIVHRCPRTDQVVLECPGPLRQGGPGWKLVQVEADGNCLFASLMLGKLMVLDQSRSVPTDPIALLHYTRQGAAICRTGYLDQISASVRDNHHSFKIGELELPLLIESATAMNPQEYLRHMRLPQGNPSWGGFLEVAVLATRWKCRVVTFQFDVQQKRATAITYSGEEVAQRHHNRGKIAIMWSGTHYDLILLSDELQNALP